MRIVALDASVDDARTERALAIALGRAPARLFLFGAAAASAARMAARDLDKRDERYLDVVAGWLLDESAHAVAGDVSAVPTRGGIEVPLIEIGCAVGVERAPLPWAPRAIEMLGAQLCIAVANDASLDPDEIDNAALWIVGGGGPFRVEQVKSRTVLHPGDVAGEGFVTCIDAGPNELQIARLDAAGNVVDARAATMTAGSRMQVQG